MITVVTGPSGCGKSTLIKRVLARLDGVRFSVSHTTRAKRDSETDGKDYYFVSPERFLGLVKRNAFVEWAVVHGAYYGTSRQELKKARSEDVLLDIDVQGAVQVKKKIQKAVFVFVLPPSFRELRRRIIERASDSPANIRKRLDTARKEVRSYRAFDYVVINGDLETAARELEAILLCPRLRLAVRRKNLGPILRSFRVGR